MSCGGDGRPRCGDRAAQEHDARDQGPEHEEHERRALIPAHRERVRDQQRRGDGGEPAQPGRQHARAQDDGRRGARTDAQGGQRDHERGVRHLLERGMQGRVDPAALDGDHRNDADELHRDRHRPRAQEGHRQPWRTVVGGAEHAVEVGEEGHEQQQRDDLAAEDRGAVARLAAAGEGHQSDDCCDGAAGGEPRGDVG